MDVDRTRIAAGWMGLAAALTAALLFAVGTWTGPLEPFVDRPWPLLASQALSVLLWTGIPGVAGWLLLRERPAQVLSGAGLLAAYGLPAGPQLVGTFAAGGTVYTWQGLGFAVFGVLLFVGALIALAALLGDPASDVLPPGRWDRLPLRTVVIAAVAVSAVSHALPVFETVGALDAFEAFRRAPLAVQAGGLLSGAALVAVAYLAVAVNIPLAVAAMLAGLALPLFLRWVTGMLGHYTEWLGARGPVLLVIEGLALAIVVGGAVLLARTAPRAVR